MKVGRRSRFDSGDDHPEDPVASLKFWPFGMPFHDGQLLSKRKVLNGKVPVHRENEKQEKQNQSFHNVSKPNRGPENCP